MMEQKLNWPQIKMLMHLKRVGGIDVFLRSDPVASTLDEMGLIQRVPGYTTNDYYRWSLSLAGKIALAALDAPDDPTPADGPSRAELIAALEQAREMLAQCESAFKCRETMPDDLHRTKLYILALLARCQEAK